MSPNSPLREGCPRLGTARGALHFVYTYNGHRRRMALSSGIRRGSVVGKPTSEFNNRSEDSFKALADLLSPAIY